MEFSAENSEYLTAHMSLLTCQYLEILLTGWWIVRVDGAEHVQADSDAPFASIHTPRIHYDCPVFEKPSRKTDADC
jgi:hypothetical protein